MFIIFGFVILSWQYLLGWVPLCPPYCWVLGPPMKLQKGGGKPRCGSHVPDFNSRDFTGVKGDKKHCEATKPRTGVDYVSGLGFPDQGLVWSSWGFACRCCGVMVVNGRLNPPSPISATPLPLAAQPPLPQIASVSAAQPIPALG